MRSIAFLVGLAMVLCVVQTAAQGSDDLVVYEAFNYGEDPGPLEGHNGGVGFQGPWEKRGFGNTKYDPTGLTFEYPNREWRLESHGGAADVASTRSVAHVNASRPLGVTCTDTIWGSFLYQPVMHPHLDSASGLLVDDNPDGVDYMAWFCVAGNEYQDELGGVRHYYHRVQHNDGDETQNMQTYLVIFKLTNVGNPGTHELTDWILQENQFEYFKSVPPDTLTEEELRNADLGPDFNQVLQRATVTSSDQCSLTSEDFLILYGYDLGHALFDELRITSLSGDDGLNAVTPIVPKTPSADFDYDGDVDGNNFLTWQNGLGISSGATHAQGDADLDGDVDENDFHIWQSDFGSGVGSYNTAIPEPTTGLLLLCFAALSMGSRHLNYIL